MTRHVRISSTLKAFTDEGIISAWLRDNFENEPNRTRWHIQTGDYETLYLTTTEVEAFITGAQAMARR